MPTACWGTNKLTEVAWIDFGYGSRWDLERNVQVSLEALHVMARYDYDWRDDIVYSYYRYEDPGTSNFFHMSDEEKEVEIQKILNLLTPSDIHRHSPLWISFPHSNLNDKQELEKGGEWLLDVFNSGDSFKWKFPKFHHDWLDYSDGWKYSDGRPMPRQRITPTGVPKVHPDWQIMQRIEDMMEVTECHHFNTLQYKMFKKINAKMFVTPEELLEFFGDEEGKEEW